MGCGSSKVESEEKVARCKARKRFMKQALAARHQFSASHAAYMQALKNVGAAFRQFGDTELRDDDSAPEAGSSSPPTPAAKPPPRPLFLPPPSPPRSPEAKRLDKEAKMHMKSDARRSGSPPLPPEDDAPPPPPPPKSSAWDIFDPFRGGGGGEANAEAAPPLPPPPSIKAKKLWAPIENASVDEAETAEFRYQLAIIPSESRKDLAVVLRELDELFLRAYASGRNVGLLLEARKIHYHSNFVDTKGFDSHSSKILNAISWSHWKSPLKRKTEEPVSSKSLVPSSSGDVGCHSGTLDRLLVWEKKLYEEMRVAEDGRLEYEKKSALLRHQDAKGDSNEAIDKTRAAIKMIQTRIVVALEGVVTAVAAVIKIRDEELYPQLLALQEGLARMWADLHQIHEQQYGVVSKMKPLDHLLGSVEATSNIHRLASTQLEAALDNWYSCLNKLITSQRDYMRNLSGWVRLCVMPFEDNNSIATINGNGTAKEPTSSTSTRLPPVHDLCLEWHQALDRIPDDVALLAIKSFVAVIKKIVELQNQELKHRRKVETLSKELDKKLGIIQNYEKKHPEVLAAAAEQQKQHQHRLEQSDDNESEDLVRDVLPPKSPLADKKAAVEMLRRRIDEEKSQVAKAVYDTRAMTLNSLHTGLPSVFQSVAGFAGVCSQAFHLLYSNAHQDLYAGGMGSYSP